MIPPFGRPDPYTRYDAEANTSGLGRRRGVSRLARVHRARLAARRLLRRRLSVDEPARDRGRPLPAVLADLPADRAGPEPRQLPGLPPALARAVLDQRDHRPLLD